MTAKCLATRLAAAIAATFAVSAFAAEVQTDTGTLDEASAAKLFPSKAPVLALCGPQLPDAAVVRRHAPAHVVLHGRRRLRLPAWPARRVPLRQGRGGHRLEWAAGEAVAAARFPRRRRPLRRHGLLPEAARRRPEDPGRSAGPQVVRHDPVGQGRRRGDRDHRQFRAGTISEGDASRRRAPPPTARPGRRRSRRPKQANEPGRFTAFIGYEWTSNTGGNNLHRNVIFRDNGDKAEPGRAVHRRMKPLGSDNPRDLWKWMAAYEEKTGGDVLAIAHNGNLQQRPHVPDRRVVHRQAASTASTPRRARAGSRSTRRRRSRATARRTRSCRPTTSSPTSSAGTRATSTSASSKKPEMLRVRVRPLGAEERPQARSSELGVNPYKFGMIGSTDSHTGARRGRRGQLLRQDLELRAEPRARATHPFVKTRRTAA